MRLKQKKELRYTQKKILKMIKHKKCQTWFIRTSVIILLGIGLFQGMPQDLKVYFVDVGQGDCCLITTRTTQKYFS